MLARDVPTAPDHAEYPKLCLFVDTRSSRGHAGIERARPGTVIRAQRVGGHIHARRPCCSPKPIITSPNLAAGAGRGFGCLTAWSTVAAAGAAACVWQAFGSPRASLAWPLPPCGFGGSGGRSGLFLSGSNFSLGFFCGCFRVSPRAQFSACAAVRSAAGSVAGSSSRRNRGAAVSAHAASRMI